MIIARKDRLTDLLGSVGEFDLADSFTTLVRDLQRRWETSEDRESARDLLICVCKPLLSRIYQHSTTRDGIAGDVAIAAVVMGDLALFKSAVISVVKAFRTDSFNALGEILRFGKAVIQIDE